MELTMRYYFHHCMLESVTRNGTTPLPLDRPQIICCFKDSEFVKGGNLLSSEIQHIRNLPDSQHDVSSFFLHLNTLHMCFCSYGEKENITLTRQNT